jgi:hypothetical protein
MRPLSRKTAAASAIALIVLGACSSSSTTEVDAGPVNNGDDAVASDDGGGCPTRDITTCSALTMGVPNYEAGVNATPPGFPPPPSGSTFCGTVGIGGLTTTEIYLSADDSATLFAYYDNALTLQGYSVMTPSTDQDCGTTLSFVIASPEAAAPLEGSIVWLPDAQAFEVNDPN